MESRKQESLQDTDELDELSRCAAEAWVSIGIVLDFGTPPPQIPGGHLRKKWQEAQVEHTPRSYPGGQLTAYIPLSVRSRTTHRQFIILCLAQFTEPLPDNKSTITLNVISSLAKF